MANVELFLLLLMLGISGQAEAGESVGDNAETSCNSRSVVAVSVNDATLIPTASSMAEGIPCISQKKVLPLEGANSCKRFTGISSPIEALCGQAEEVGADLLLMVDSGARIGRASCVLPQDPTLDDTCDPGCAQQVESYLEVSLYQVSNGALLAHHLAIRTRELAQPVSDPSGISPVVKSQLASMVEETMPRLSGAGRPSNSEPIPELPVLKDKPGTPRGLITVEEIRKDPRWRSSWPRQARERWYPEKILVGSGDRYDTWEHGKGTIWHKSLLERKIPINAHAVWVTRDFDRTWFSAQDLQEMNRDGILPVVILYYFGDDVSREFVTAQYSNYVAWLQRVLAELQGDYPLLVVLEPEFNNIPENGEHHVLDWPPFSALMIRSAEEVRLSLPSARVGVCPGDFRSYNLWDVLGPVAPHLDFLAYQELWASTRPNSMTEEAEDVTDHALMFTTYLSVVFQKPVLLTYLGVSTFSRSHGEDWTRIQALIWRNLTTRIGSFLDGNAFGFLAFAYLDDPSHVGYFDVAERHWGLADKLGRAKPGLEEFRKLAKKIQGLNLKR